MPAQEIRLFLCGDVMTGRGVDQILPHPCAPDLFEPWLHDAREYVALAEEANGPIPRPVDFSYVWGDALDALRDEALAARIVNLETSVTRDGQPWPDKDIHYRMHPDNVPCIAAARVDVCVLANNHALDWGRDALAETLEALHGAKLRTAGAGLSLARALEPAAVDLPAGRVLVLGMGGTCSGVLESWAAAPDRPGVAVLGSCSQHEARAVGEQVARTRRPGDVVVASVHWGSNWGYEVEPEHVSFAHALVERGVDVVHGHSSHHPRPIEVHRGKLVLYGCGDFLNDYEGIGGYERYRPDRVLAYLPRIDARTGELLDLRMLPLRTRRLRLERASAEDATWLAQTLSRASRPFGTRLEIVDGMLSLRW